MQQDLQIFNSKEEQRAVIQFLWSKGVKPVDIHHKRMQTRYCDTCLSQRYVYEWCKKFVGITD